jgi:hypothetical protein
MNLTALQVIFTIRVYALWNRSRVILFICIGAATLNIGCYAVIISYSTATEFVTGASAPFTGCTILSSYAKGYLMFVASITFETTILTLTVIKSYPLARQASRSSVFTMILEDGLIYYIVMLSLHVINLIILFTPSLAAASIMPSYPTIAVMAVACNRLLIRQQRLLLGHRSEVTSHFPSTNIFITPIALRSIHRNGIDPPLSSRGLRGDDRGLKNKRKGLVERESSRTFDSDTDLDGRTQQDLRSIPKEV